MGTADDAIQRRWEEVNRELEEIARKKLAAPGDEWVQREQELLDELDHIEHEAGVRYIERQRQDRDKI